MNEKRKKMFPSRIAKGENFCNRSEEKRRIELNIDQIHHTLIISPRRYGKTSLAFQTIHEKGQPFAYIQFFNAYRDEIVVKRFIEGLKHLFAQLIPKTQKALIRFKELIRHAKVSVQVSGVEMEVSINPISKEPGDIITGLLKDIEDVLQETEQQVVVFFDEFQDIVESDISDELQTVLRDFAQLTDHVTFIISGSHRHMLSKLFDDSNKPFYKLFDRIDLQRINKEDYVPFLQSLAQEEWNSELDDVVVNYILSLTECHAYYVNRLCAKIWRSTTLPNMKDIAGLWQQLVEEEFSSIANDLSGLTKNQRIVLQEMSRYDILYAPTSAEFLNRVGLSARSTVIAVEALEKTDHIEIVGDGYRVIDPATKHILTS